MANNPIVAVEVQETEFGEKVVLQSPYDAKDFIKVMPWKAMSEEMDEHGTIDGMVGEYDVATGAIEAAKDFGFSDDFSTHATWDPSALGPNTGAWLVDVEHVDEVFEFFEFCGFEVVDER